MVPCLRGFAEGRLPRAAGGLRRGATPGRESRKSLGTKKPAWGEPSGPKIEMMGRLCVYFGQTCGQLRLRGNTLEANDLEMLRRDTVVPVISVFGLNHGARRIAKVCDPKARIGG